jgi:hypothetical protein
MAKLKIEYFLSLEKWSNVQCTEKWCLGFGIRGCRLAGRNPWAFQVTPAKYVCTYAKWVHQWCCQCSLTLPTKYQVFLLWGTPPWHTSMTHHFDIASIRSHWKKSLLCIAFNITQCISPTKTWQGKHTGAERERGRREGERERNDCKKVWPVKVRGWCGHFVQKPLSLEPCSFFKTNLSTSVYAANDLASFSYRMGHYLATRSNPKLCFGSSFFDAKARRRIFFCSDQGCQVFLGTPYQNRKKYVYQIPWYITKWPQRIPKGRKVY